MFGELIYEGRIEFLAVLICKLENINLQIAENYPLYVYKEYQRKGISTAICDSLAHSIKCRKADGRAQEKEN